MDYFANRELNKHNAEIAIKYFMNFHTDSIQNSIERSIAYDYSSRESIYNKTDIKTEYPIKRNASGYIIDDIFIEPQIRIVNNIAIKANIIFEKTTTAKSLINYIEKYRLPDKKAVLNFASYKHPGGMFLEGSMAQEESLCHCSTLYPVLKGFQNSYYDFNKKHLNNSLYDHRLIYSPDIQFVKRSTEGIEAVYEADVITCAFPNISPYLKYGKYLNPEYYYDLLINRVDCIMQTAAMNKVDTIILGAIGCGVFKNSPNLVANIFANRIFGKWRNYFNNIIFAIPDDNTINLFEFAFKTIPSPEDMEGIYYHE